MTGGLAKGASPLSGRRKYTPFATTSQRHLKCTTHSAPLLAEPTPDRRLFSMQCQYKNSDHKRCTRRAVPEENYCKKHPMGTRRELNDDTSQKKPERMLVITVWVVLVLLVLVFLQRN
jgi:hypothetical protein